MAVAVIVVCCIEILIINNSSNGLNRFYIDSLFEILFQALRKKICLSTLGAFYLLY